ncbi:MAG: SurA N-terminal domain-containing protein [Acidobacteriota bacterium]|jgi:parvulin-like peptidyl-prolyl isomerase
MNLAVMLRSNAPKVPALALLAALAAPLSAPPAVRAQSGQVPTPGPQQSLPGARAQGGGVIDRVLVRVGDRAILYSDFEAQLQDRLNAVAAQVPQAQLDAQMPMLRMELMRGLVEEAMLEMRAEELGIEASPNDVDRAIANIREQNGLQDDTQWEQALQQSGLTEAQLREQAAGSIVQQRMMQQEIMRRVFVSQREVANYYEEHKSDFTEPEQVLYQQIIFVYQGADRAPVRERAENALTELRAGISLSAVGNKYAQAGDLVQGADEATWISPEDIQPEVRAAIETLTPLSYSDLIEGRYGYHIIQLMDRREGQTRSLEEVAGEIHQLLENRKIGEQLGEYTKELMQDVSLEVYAEEFKDLPNAWAEESQGAPAGTPRQRQ